MDEARSAGTVLIVDDSEIVVEFLAVVLEDEGWTVHTRTTPFLDPDDIRSIAADVVLLDVGIPGMSERDLPVVVRAFRVHEPTHVLLHSGRDAIELAAYVGASGADGFICKNVSGEDALIARMAEYRR